MSEEKEMIEEASKVDVTDEDTIRKIVKYFPFKTDLDKKNFKGFSKNICGHYPFHSPPVLKMTDGFTFVLTPSILAEILFRTSKNRVGPSVHASQVGVNYDFFIIVNPKEPEKRASDEPEYETFINSSIIGLSEEGHKEREISASYPALYLNIERPVWADIKYFDVDGQENRERVQHEWSRYFIQNYCLSRGKPFWKFATKLHRDMAIKKRNKRLGKEYAVHTLI